MAATKGMIFMEAPHPIIADIMSQKLVPDAKREPADIKISDTDDVSYTIKVLKDQEHIVQLTMNMAVLKSISHTVKPLLKKKYGKYLKQDSASSVTLEVDVRSAPNAEEVVDLFSSLKRNCMAAPFEEAFDALKAGSSGKLKSTVIPYRKKEQLVLQPTADRVNVFVTIDFDEETDAAIAEVILQEFTEAKRNIPNAPNVVWSRDMPVELSRVKGVKKQGSEVGYIMFQVFSRHVASTKLRDQVITLFLTLRSYLHYHIKASKAHLHTRMRRRVDLLLKLLNRAQQTTQEDEEGGRGRKKAYRKV